MFEKEKNVLFFFQSNLFMLVSSINTYLRKVHGEVAGDGQSYS